MPDQALGVEILYNAVSPEVYRNLDFPSMQTFETWLFSSPGELVHN